MHIGCGKIYQITYVQLCLLEIYEKQLKIYFLSKVSLP